MYYELSLQDLVDENDDALSYFYIENVRDDDLEWPWLHGIKFSNPPSSPLALKVDLDDPDAGACADYVLGPIPLVTRGFRKVLDDCGVTNIDYYPVSIDGADRFGEFPEYLAINIVGKVAIADKRKSEYTEAFGHMGATRFDKFVFDPATVRGLKVFRMAERMAIVVVSEEIKVSSEKAGIPTLMFRPLV